MTSLIINDPKNWRLCESCQSIFNGAPATTVGSFWYFMTMLPYHSDIAFLASSVRAGCSLCCFISKALEIDKLQVLGEQPLLLTFPRGRKNRSERLNGLEERHMELHVKGNALPLKRFSLIEQDDFKKLPTRLQAHLVATDFPVPSDERFSIAIYKHCIKNHTKCRSSTPSWYPTRLIKIAQNEDQVSLRLVTASEIKSGSQFVTLSHCWGTKPIMRLMKETLSAFAVDIPVFQLPKTFQDAVKIATWLEVSYIWIDSLCILQDSPEDWRRESAVMDQIFENSQCTISADRAVDGTMGCFRTDAALEPMRLLIPSLGRPWLVELMGDLKQRLADEPLARRAWALQERILSPRILHFGTKQIFWNCVEMATFQTYFQSLDDDDLGWEKLPSYSSGTRELSWKSWNYTVQEYSRRSLTRGIDKLVALSGIAKRYMRFFEDSYIAGHFRSRLPLDLLWHAPESSRTCHRSSVYRAPTWSWASLDGEVELLPAYFHGTEGIALRRTVFKVLEVKTDLVGDDLTGEIKGGFLRGLGILQRARWIGKGSALGLQNGPLGAVTADSPLIYSSIDDPSELDEAKQLYCLPIQWHFNGTQVGLILCDSLQQGYFQRIGYFDTSKDPQSGQLGSWTEKKSEVLAALKYSYSSTTSKGTDFAERWNKLCQRNENWSRKQWDNDTRRYRWRKEDGSYNEDSHERSEDRSSRDIEDGPHFLFERDLDSFKEFKPVEPQIITIV